MLGSALYFPHIDVRDPVWLRSTLLFWDDIQTIAPSDIKKPYRNTDSIVCSEAGLLQPLRCDMYPELIEDIGRQVLRAANPESDGSRALGKTKRKSNVTADAARAAGTISRDFNDALTELTGMHPSRISPEMREIALRFGMARIHAGKIPPEIRDAFQLLGLARMHPQKLSYALMHLMDQDFMKDEDGSWLLVDGQFAAAYMAALASKLSRQLSLSPLTPDREAHGFSFRFMFDDMFDASRHSAGGALLNLTMRGIRIDASVPIEKIIKFKLARKDQYSEFKAQIEELTGVLQNEGDDAEHTLEMAKQIYRSKVERGLRQFKRELEQNSIASAWDGAFTAATVSASSTTALAYLSGLSGPALLGVAASVSVLGIGVKNYLAGRKIRISNPYSYLHDVGASFGLPDFS